MTDKRKKFWSYSAGEYHYRVRVYESPSGIIYGEMKDLSNSCGYRAVSLKHRDRDRAIAWARQQSAQWMASGELERVTTPTLSRIFALYRQYQTPGKVATHQKDDVRRTEMFTRVLGAQKDLSKITLREWQGFISDRRCGALSARGLPVPADERRPVRDGSIWSDLVFLNSVINWATKWRTEAGAYLMRENPCRGFEVPKEKNPKRPVVTAERFAAIRKVAGGILMQRDRSEPWREEPSYLLELLDIAWGTGRRISAILALRIEDLRLDVQPYGAIQWPAETDKIGKEWLVPVNQQVREAIDRLRLLPPLKIAGPLFPSPWNPSVSISQPLAEKWLREAETLAGVEKQNGSLWHAFRRGWATLRKGLPVQDLMALGGWTDPTCLQKIYQQADWGTMVMAAAEPSKKAAGGHNG